jgi:hypothetical protein
VRIPGGNVAKPGAVVDQDKRIEVLKRRADDLGDSHMKAQVMDDCPAETEETFWKEVVEYEEAPWTTHFLQLESAGVSLPPPDSLNDEELTEKLWEVIHTLVLLQVFIEQTDHLSDRTLYSQLWADCLREEVKQLTPSAGAAWHIPMLGGCSDEDSRLYLMYYADEDSRRHWQEEFPDELLPAHEELPYHRDHLLPKPDFGSSASRTPN